MQEYTSTCGMGRNCHTRHVDNSAKNQYSYSMKQLRVKGQALALVLIIVVVSVIIAFSITSRVVQDIRQQGEEKASTRAETFSEAAVENITLQIQSGQLAPNPSGAPTALFNISTESTPGMTTLGICDPNATNPENQCDANSIAQVGYYKMIVQFKSFDSENLEVFMTPPSGTGSTTPVPAANSKAIIHLKSNTSFDIAGSKLLVKGFVRSAAGLQVLSECIIDINAPANATFNCLPATMKITKKAECNDVLVDSNLNAAGSENQTKLGDYCIGIETVGSGISSYRIKPLLKATDPAVVPYVDISVTADPTANPNHELPIYQMAMITAGVYSGTAATDQQVFQQSTRLVLLNKSVPEVADYVLYNGSNNPVVKSK